MNKQLDRKLARLSLYLLIFAGVTFFNSAPTFATNAGASGAVGGGCSSGCCVDAKSNGATWVRIPYDSDNAISLKKLMSDNLSGYMEIKNDDGSYAYTDSTVSQCKKSGGYVYVLVTPIGCYNNFAGPVAMNIAKNIYDGFSGYTIPFSKGSDVLNIFNNAATNGKINGYAYSDDSTMSWFCGAKDASVETTYQSHTTIKIDNTSTSVKSGWDGFGSTAYNVSADTSEVYITTTHKIRRTDDKNIRSDVGWLTFDQKNQQSGWTNTEFTTGNNHTETVKTIESEKITLSPGNNLVCRGLYHDSVIIMKADGSARAQNSSGEYSKSNACITISRPVKTDPTASTTLQYIGEATSGGIKGNATFYTNLSDPGDGSIFRTATDGDKEYFARDQEDPDSRDYQPDNSPSILCNHFRSAGPYGCQNGAPDSIPDDVNYLNAKICAIPAGKESEPNGQTKTIQRTIKTPSGNETQDITINLYDYYWKIKSVSCSPIAKKPNFRVTGGSIYAAGAVATTTSNKFSGQTFGSWSEYLLVADGMVKGLASGASIATGSSHVDIKDNSPLTIANNSNTIGNSGVTLSDSFITGIRSRFINTSNYNHNQIYVDQSPNDTYQITPTKSDELNNTGKLNIIYAKNINISSAVTIVNAWLIADNTIDTCADISDADLSASTCTQSLSINGLAYAKNIKLRRTAGANGTNLNADSAEIINLTAGDYARSYHYANTNYLQPMEVYLRELAPRV